MILENTSSNRERDAERCPLSVRTAGVAVVRGSPRPRDSIRPGSIFLTAWLAGAPGWAVPVLGLQPQGEASWGPGAFPRGQLKNTRGGPRKTYSGATMPRLSVHGPRAARQIQAPEKPPGELEEPVGLRLPLNEHLGWDRPAGLWPRVLSPGPCAWGDTGDRFRKQAGIRSPKVYNVLFSSETPWAQVSSTDTDTFSQQEDGLSWTHPALAIGPAQASVTVTSSRPRGALPPLLLCPPRCRGPSSQSGRARSLSPLRAP